MPNSLDLEANFTDLANFIGSFQGWSDNIKTPYYISDLISAAHGVASKAFDKETAVAANSLGISHMYEWGTVGINPAPDAPPLNPLTRAARLWVHRLGGTGANRTIDFGFRPSTVNVPMPQNIGTANDKQRPKKKYKFAARPWVTEYGIPIVIKPKFAQALFIPFNDNPSSISDQRSQERGYMMYPYPVTIEGSKNAGNFSRHWFGWWNTEGKTIIDETTQAIVNGDMDAIIYTGKGKGSTLGTYSRGKATKSFTLQVNDAKARAYALSRSRESAAMRIWQKEAAEEQIGLITGGRA